MTWIYPKYICHAVFSHFRNGSVESQDGNDSDQQSRQSPTLDEENTCQDNRQDDKIRCLFYTNV